MIVCSAKGHTGISAKNSENDLRAPFTNCIRALEQQALQHARGVTDIPIISASEEKRILTEIHPLCDRFRELRESETPEEYVGVYYCHEWPQLDPQVKSLVRKYHREIHILLQSNLAFIQQQSEKHDPEGPMGEKLGDALFGAYIAILDFDLASGYRLRTHMGTWIKNQVLTHRTERMARVYVPNLPFRLAKLLNDRLDEERGRATPQATDTLEQLLRRDPKFRKKALKIVNLRSRKEPSPDEGIEAVLGVYLGAQPVLAGILSFGTPNAENEIRGRHRDPQDRLTVPPSLNLIQQEGAAQLDNILRAALIDEPKANPKGNERQLSLKEASVLIALYGLFGTPQLQYTEMSKRTKKGWGGFNGEVASSSMGGHARSGRKKLEDRLADFRDWDSEGLGEFLGQPVSEHP